MGRPWSREEIEQFVKSLDGVILALITAFAVLVLVLGLAVMSDKTDNTPKDSQGIPCTISTAQNADGTPECQ